MLVLAAARARDEAIRLADDGRYTDARATLRHAAAQLRDSSKTMDVSRAAALEREALALDVAAPMLDSSYADSPSARKRLRYDAHRTRRGKNR